MAPKLCTLNFRGWNLEGNADEELGDERNQATNEDTRTKTKTVSAFNQNTAAFEALQRKPQRWGKKGKKGKCQGARRKKGETARTP